MYVKPICYIHSEADLLADQRDPWQATYYRRAIDTDKVLFSAKYTLSES